MYYKIERDNFAFIGIYIEKIENKIRISKEDYSQSTEELDEKREGNGIKQYSKSLKRLQ